MALRRQLYPAAASEARLRIGTGWFGLRRRRAGRGARLRIGIGWVGLQRRRAGHGRRGEREARGRREAGGDRRCGVVSVGVVCGALSVG